RNLDFSSGSPIPGANPPSAPGARGGVSVSSAMTTASAAFISCAKVSCTALQNGQAFKIAGTETAIAAAVTTRSAVGCFAFITLLLFSARFYFLINFLWCRGQCPGDIGSISRQRRHVASQ